MSDEARNKELPNGWESASIEQIVLHLTDGSHNPPKKQNSGFPMLSALDIQNNKIASGGGRRIAQKDFKREHRRTQIKAGDVLLTIVGTVGRSAVVPFDIPDFTVQRSVAVLRPNTKIDSKYLMYQLQSPKFQQQLHSKTRGTAQEGVYLKTLRQLLVDIAPLDEQQRIIAKIEELFSDLDAGVAALERVQANLQRYRASVLKAAVEGGLTQQWRAEHPDVEPADQLLQRILRERREKWEQDQLAKYEAKGKKPPKNWKDKYKEPAAPTPLTCQTCPPAGAG